MKVGDYVPPRQVRGKPCPRCKSKVLKDYPTGFVIETAQVVEKNPHGFKVQDNWHCPKCGLWEKRYHDITPSGLKVEPKREFTPTFTEPRKFANSSDKSRRKRKYQ